MSYKIRVAEELENHLIANNKVILSDGTELYFDLSVYKHISHDDDGDAVEGVFEVIPYRELPQEVQYHIKKQILLES